MSMVPSMFPNRPDLDIYASMTPAKAVGGDLYDFLILDDYLYFCLVDVSGTGVPASLFMTVTRSMFRTVSSHESSPDRIVSILNESMAEINELNMFVTLFVGVLDLETGLMHYCNAGHDAPLLVGRDVGQLPCDANLPIGLFPDFKFTQQEISIDPGTTIFLFTDGLNEAENMEHAQFGDMRIWNTAEAVLAEGKHQPQSIIQTMTDKVHQFVGHAEQSDDLTMLAIQYKDNNKVKK
jgi:sigma-B regulation protein RsbU (phosphoserine phosphatase)